MSIFNRLWQLIDSVGMPPISTICSREEFSCLLERQLARAERSNRIFTVVEFDIGDIESVEINREIGKQLLQVLAKRLRCTDEVGWLQNYHIGVLLYDTPPEGAQVFSKKILELLPKTFTPPDFKIHIYPTGDQTKDGSSYQGVVEKRRANQRSSSKDILREKLAPVRGMCMLYPRAMPTGKRLMDIFGALLFLFLLFPLLVLAGIMIKVVSSGPVFFKQRRVGYGGRVFTLYKLRTMKVNADTSAHRRYLSELIAILRAKNKEESLW